MRTIVLLLLLLLSSVILFFVFSTDDTPQNIAETVNQFITEDKYEQALQALEEAEPAQTETDLTLLREKVHLNYGLFLEYRGEEGMTMRTRMTGALRQYIQTLKINPNNQKARAEIKKIMSVYATMPQTPPEEIMNELRELGFNVNSQS